jgi:hypothetical protein
MSEDEIAPAPITPSTRRDFPSRLNINEIFAAEFADRLPEM